jgi:hypothetical protein
MDVKVAELTVKAVDPVTPLNVAEIFAVPAETAVATPSPETVATAVLSDVHVDSRFTVCVLESLNVPVAVNESLVNGGIVLPAGVKEMDTIVAFVTVRVTALLTLPRVAVIIAVPGVSPFANPTPLTLATLVLDDIHEH